MNTCPFFQKCGGCKFDFASPDYRANKTQLIKKIPVTNDAVWIEPGQRRRAEFAFADGKFGFYAPGSKNIVQIDKCPLLTGGLNNILGGVAKLPFNGAGNVLITQCDNGFDVAVISNVPYFSPEFKHAADTLDILRVAWNGRVVSQRATPLVKFGDVSVEYPIGAFLQPSIAGESALRNLIIAAAAGAKKVADLFCGVGTFTFALNADGFDIAGGINRDLSKRPLKPQNLKKYDCVVMDPPRGGALAQSKELAKSSVARIIYVSCNPETFMRDKEILMRGGYALAALTPVDQFAGSAHWELVGVFDSEQ